MAQRKDLTGMVFGRLEVINRTDDYISPKGEHKSRWLCKCQCGNVTEVTGADLLRGDTKSCGCYQREFRSINKSTHGQSKSRLYQVWKNIKARCYNPHHKNYADYGGRGIVMCPEWKESYESFYEWAKTNGYREDLTEALTVDRIDNNGNYEPNNCRMVNRVVQANNRRNSILVTYNDETHPIKWWANKIGIPYNTLYGRITRGWDIKRALTPRT